MPKLKASDWGEVFWHLGNHIPKERIIIVFDEISWMGSCDPDFLGYLKNAWDLYFSKNPKLMLILCGSVSSWIEENILSSTGFLGRISVDMIVKEMALSEAQEFWGSSSNKISAYEKFKFLAVTGGVPKYLEEMLPEESAESNIQRLCFQQKGLLFREYDQIFSDLFSKKAQTYTDIVSTLSKEPLTLGEICHALQIQKSGSVSNYLRDLVLAGFLTEDCTWNLKSKISSTLKQFRLSDNYLRFYLKYIQPNKEKILKDLFENRSLLNLPGFETIMGLQFENLVVNNIKEVFKLLKIDPIEVVMAGPFFQRKTKLQKGCQVDLLIQTRYQTLYLCEIKFYASEITKHVVEEMEEKIRRLTYPRGYSIRPILLHVNGVSQGVKESEIFTQIIDFSEFFHLN